jgi:hypothetical protein
MARSRAGLDRAALGRVARDASMSISSPNAAKLPMPRWAYVPGEAAEADADYETLAQAKLLVPSRFRDFVPARHPALRYGIALNDSG